MCDLSDWVYVTSCHAEAANLTHQQTNAVVMGLSFDSGVFETYSRLNHSCRPNVMNNWDSKTQRLYVHALCDIAVGEELTTAYVDVLLRRKERQEILKGHYAFECTCKACVATKEEVLQSDTRRIWLSYFDQSMSQEGLMAKPFQNLAKVGPDGQTPCLAAPSDAFAATD